MPVLGVPQDLLEEDARRRALEAMASGAVEAPAFVPLPAGPPASRVAVASGVPQEVLAPPRDEYGEALAEVRRREMGHLGGDLGSGIIKAFTGVGRDPAMQQAMDAQTQAPVVEYLQRQKMADDKRRLDLTAQKAAPKPGSAPLSDDPTSPESRHAQEVYSYTYPNRYTPEQLAKFSAADFQRLKLADKSPQMEGIEADREAEVGRDKRATADREQRARLAAQRLDLDYDKLDQQQQLAFLQVADAREGRAEAAAARGEKRAGELAERNVGGFEIDPANPPSADASKKMAEAAIARDEIMGSLSNLERLYSSLGSEQVGARAGEMESEWMNITNRLRTLNEMGVPNGADYAMLGKQIEDPTEWKAVTTSKGRGLAKMKTLREQIARKMSATATALKFRPAQGAAATKRSMAPATKVASGPPVPQAPTRSPKDEAALKWARENPTDPRSAAILQRLGETP